MRFLESVMVREKAGRRLPGAARSWMILAVLNSVFT